MDAAPIALDRSRHDVRMDGVYFVRAWADGPFSKSLDPGNYSYCVVVRAGRLRLETDFPAYQQIELAAGDAVAVSGLAPHVFRSTQAGAAVGSDRFERQRLSEPGRRAEVELIVGVAPIEALALGSLMLGPIVVKRDEHPDLSRRLWRAVEMLEDEYGDDSWIDRGLVIRRLAEIMLVNMMRRVFADRRGQEEAVREPAHNQIVQAINAFLHAPERPWTLAALAKVAGMSRTRFAEEFKLVTGQTPARIISRMRLTAVARRLAVDAVSVEAAADEAGYSSSAAFVRAFQREFGETPARWRRRREARGAGASPRGLARTGARSQGARQSKGARS
jgi:AraC-like DNA-binding protein